MRFVLYNHVGSANHGCEALVRTIYSMLRGKDIILLSDNPLEEEKYGVTDIVEVHSAVSDERRNPIDFIYSYFQLKLKKNYFYLDILPYKKPIANLRKTDVLVSIGGDIFCYENYPKYNLLHRFALKKIRHSILIGCSIEPESLSDKVLINDLRTFEIITAREHITYNALTEAGFENVIYCPDSAFSLPAMRTIFPESFIPGNTVGINVSPLFMNKCDDAELIMDNLRTVVKYILEYTDASIAFIPHVTWKENDDRVPLGSLYDEFKATNRVCMIEDQTAEKLKWIISQCSYFIGARTHATIAAYSSGVPTLALGYSVKSKGIAEDIFGTAENFVIPYQKIQSKDAVLESLLWIYGKSEEIKKILVDKTKKYQGIIEKTGEMIRKKYEVL